MVRLTYTLIFVLGFLFCNAQGPLLKQWDNGFGGTDDDNVSGFQLLPDGGFMLNGSSTSGISGDKTQATNGGVDCWFLKIDSVGNKVWDKSYGGAGDDYQRSLIRTTDGGYASGGRSSSGIGGDKTQASQGGFDFWIVKMDSARNIKWDKDFGSTMDDYFLTMQQTKDGGYIFGGWTLGGIGGDKTQASKGSADCWVVKVDSLGNKQWDKDYGGAGDDFLYSIRLTKDGGYLLGAWTNTGIDGDKTQATKGGYDYWIIKIDSLGNIKWDRDFGGSSDDGLSTMEPTKDGGYILAGKSASPISGDKTEANRDLSNNTLDFWIVKIDSLGNKSWDKRYGGNVEEDDIGSISQTMDDGFLISGTSYSPISGDKTESNLGTEQSWIVKTDQSGNLEWNKTLHTNSTTTHDETGLGVQTKDGCYVFANYTIGGIGGDKSVASQGGVDYWVIKYCDTVCSFKAHFISSDTVFCNESGNCIDFTDQTACNPTSWKWSFPGAVPDTSNQQNPTNICYFIPGSYSVTLITSNGSNNDTLVVSPMIIFSSGPSAPIITMQGGDTICSSAACFYQWYRDGVPIPGATQQCYVPVTCGHYSVYITDCNNCSILSAFSYDPCQGTNDLAAQSLGLYPNPAKEGFTVYGLPFTVGVTIDVFDVLGKRVYSEMLNNKKETIDCKQFSPGIYIVEVKNGERIYRTKFVKE